MIQKNQQHGGKPLTFQEALKILNQMHFGACVIRSGRNRGTKKIRWTSLVGDNCSTPFLRETPWEQVLEYAYQLVPVWDRSWLFEVGDVIEFEWFWAARSHGVILERGESLQDYLVQSDAFLVSGRRDRLRLTNYDLKFCKKAVKVAFIEAPRF